MRTCKTDLNFEAQLPQAFFVRFYELLTLVLPKLHDTGVPWLPGLRARTTRLHLGFGRLGGCSILGGCDIFRGFRSIHDEV